MIQGITLAGVFFDEVALMPESFVNQATGRCSVDGSKFWFNCNPDGPYHWFKVNWIDKSIGYLGAKKAEQLEKEAEKKGENLGLKKLLYLHFTMDDNLSLSEKIKLRYRNMYRGVFFKRYILGLWAMAEGIIYDMFSGEVHVLENLEALKWTDEYYVSCDYGTQNAMVFLLWRKTATGTWICVKEYYYSGRDKNIQKTDVEYANDLTEFIDGIKIKAVVVDPSAASFIAQLKKQGFHVKKAKNDVLDGIRFVGTLLNLKRILFYKECENTIREFASYAWDSKAVERGEDKPLKQEDHAMDAVRYFVMTVIRIKPAIRILE